MKSPTPDQIRKARGHLTQSQAASLLGKSYRAFQNWESPIESKNHRRMDAALFELFLIKLKK